MAIEKRDQDRLSERVSERPVVAPRVDIYENEHEFLVLADMPGVKKDALDIRVDKDQLTLEGRRNEGPERAPLALEQRPVNFRRSFVLPGGIDVDKIDARLDAGVLRLSLPKSAALKPRTIPVRVG